MFRFYVNGVVCSEEDVSQWIAADLPYIKRHDGRLISRWQRVEIGINVRGYPADDHLTQHIHINSANLAFVESSLYNPFVRMMLEDLICVLERRGFQINDLHSREE